MPVHGRSSQVPVPAEGVPDQWDAVLAELAADEGRRGGCRLMPGGACIPAPPEAPTLAADDPRIAGMCRFV